MGRIFLCPVLALCLLPSGVQGDGADDPFVRATAAVEAAAPRAQADPARPVFHVTSPAQWINDPNGPIFHQGFYHLFYQLHPFSDASGPKYWGHVRSRDLVKWEPLPIALWPSSESGEAEIWSGCCTLNGRGEPMIFYTSIARGRSAMDHAEQWAATSDDTLLHWRKSPANPVLTEALHGEKKIYDWRDPFVFHDGRNTFLITGGNLNQAKGGQAVVNIYHAENPELTQWTYRGVLFQHPDPEARTAECPNFFRLGKRWVLVVSPYGKVQYFMGDFDATTCRFQPRARGVLDSGPNFYAPNTMQVPDGRHLVWGWVNGFPGGHGWNGCLSLPRQLSLSRDGQLRQSPAPQLSKLRGKPIKWRNLSLADHDQVLSLPKTNTLELSIRIDLQTAEAVALEFRSSDKQARPVELRFNGSELTVMGVKKPLPLAGNAEELSLRIFLDRSVLEVFANETVCVTKTITPLAADATLAIHAQGGHGMAKLVEAWPMKTIW
ncbi:MAG TPA: glycoside hydrolase family 32 protein [Candidatus Binatia bacterium]|jgi:beta-fructofuranosidase|nr:glycoside hydrolase family 32 protein [Candidatus Binatia bacterium]